MNLESRLVVEHGVKAGVLLPPQKQEVQAGLEAPTVVKQQYTGSPINARHPLDRQCLAHRGIPFEHLYYVDIHQLELKPCGWSDAAGISARPPRDYYKIGIVDLRLEIGRFEPPRYHQWTDVNSWLVASLVMATNHHVHTYSRSYSKHDC